MSISTSKNNFELDTIRIIVQHADPLSPDFIHISRVNTLFLQACVEQYPLINSEEFYKKFSEFLNNSDFYKNNKTALDNELSSKENILKYRINIASRFYSTSNPIGYGKRFDIIMPTYLTRGPMLTNLTETNSYKGMLPYNFSCHLLEFVHHYNIPCGKIRDSFNDDIRSIRYSFQFCGKCQPRSFLPTSPTLTYPAESALSLKFFDYFNNQQLTDCTIQCRGGAFEAHRAFLGANSKVFETLFSTPMKEGKDRKITLDENVKLFRVFISYLYHPTDVFKDHPEIDPVDLFNLAHRYEIDNLVDRCAKYIGDNGASKDWENIGRLGLVCNNLASKHFLFHTSNYHRIHRGDSLPDDLKEEFKKYHLPCHLFTQEVCVNYDVGYGNTLGICFHTGFDTNGQIAAPPKGYEYNKKAHLWGYGQSKDSLWCKLMQPFKWTPKGWRGSVPIGKEYQYIIWEPTLEEAKWEDFKTPKQEDRNKARYHSVNDYQEGCLQVSDIKFK